MIYLITHIHVICLCFCLSCTVRLIVVDCCDSMVFFIIGFYVKEFCIVVLLTENCLLSSTSSNLFNDSAMIRLDQTKSDHCDVLNFTFCFLRFANDIRYKDSYFTI